MCERARPSVCLSVRMHSFVLAVCVCVFGVIFMHTYIHIIYMYVYVCMYVCMYVCRYVGM